MYNEERHVLNSCTKYYLCDQLKKNEMGRECGMYGREERGMQGFGGGIWGKESTRKI